MGSVATPKRTCGLNTRSKLWPRSRPGGERESVSHTALESTAPRYAPMLCPMSEKWDRRFIALARHIAEWSKDPSTKVGCVVVGPDREIRSTGFNGFPRGIDDTPERLNNRALKYPLVCHAEENAIMHAARTGISLKGCSAYVTWPPCTRCARSLVQAGVSEVLYPAELQIPDRWREDFEMSSGMLDEAGVRSREVPDA